MTGLNQNQSKLAWLSSCQLLDVPPTGGLHHAEDSSAAVDEPITEPDASEILDSEGLLVLRHLFSDDDHDDLESVEALPTNPDVDDSSSSSDDDDDKHSETFNADDHGNPASEMDVESQPLFSSEESAPAPLEQGEPSSFGPMRSARRLSGRRQAAPMPESLQAPYRMVTALAPVHLGGLVGMLQVLRPYPPLDHGNVNPDSVT